MNCSNCKEPMVVLDLDDVEIDYCVKCGSIWLDSGELELLLESAAEKDAVIRSFAPGADTGEKTVKCPICAKKMEKTLCAGVLIDKCPAGHGLWFDEGELHAIIEKTSLTKDNKVLNMLKDILKNKLKEQTNKEGS